MSYLIIVFLMFFTSNISLANDFDDSKTEVEDDTILKYDVKTGETTKVDMEKIRQEIESKSISNNISKSNISYNHNQLDKIKNSSINIAFSGLPNGMQKIDNTATYPNNITCRMYLRNPDTGYENFGSAAIVGPKVAVTCAHCIFDKTDGLTQFVDVTLYPGYNRGIPEGEVTEYDTVYYSQRWKETQEEEYDWAILLLKRQPGDDWFGAQSFASNSDLKDMSVTCLGYPNDTKYGFDWNAPYQYMTGDKIKTVSSRLFSYTGYTVGGFSGAPVFNSDYNIVGIHRGLTSNTDDTPQAVRMKDNMVELIIDLQSK